MVNNMGFFSDIGDFCSGVVDDMAAGYDTAGEIFEMAGEHFSNGNYLGGIGTGITATFTGIGNTITAGQANKWGEGVIDDIESGDANQFEKILDRKAQSMAEAELLQSDLEEAGELGYANLMGGVDVGCYALDVVGGLGVTSAAKKAVSVTAGKYITKKVAQEGVEQIAKTATKEVVGEVAEQAAKTATKEVIGEVAEQTAKTATKEALEEIAEQTTKKAVKDTVANTAAKSFAEATASQVTKEVGNQAVKSAWTKFGAMSLVEMSLLQADSNQVNRIKENVEKDGVDGAIVKEVLNQGTTAVGDVTGVAKDAAGFVANTLGNSWLAKHPGLAKVVNTIRATAYATRETLPDTMPGSYALAVMSKASDNVKSWLSGKEKKYANEDIKAIAKTKQRNALDDGKGWSDYYAERVSKLDNELGIEIDRNDSVENNVNFA